MTASASSSSNNNGVGGVGILGMEVYTPWAYASQDKLEDHAGVSKGRYTIGLGQEGLAVCGDAEDINSLALTVVHSLMEKYNIDPSEIGRLEVGTETLVDKSKSTKTVLMQLFENNTDIEGATIVNACYGGTAALLNAFAWVAANNTAENENDDNRMAIVVAADIAAYARGPARPTGGAGAVAILVGRDAPLWFRNRERATHAAHVWDFFKPDHSVEYPTVNGALSQTCYYRALEDVYTRLATKMEASFPQTTKNEQQEGDHPSLSSSSSFDTSSSDYFVFHAPYNKLVQKSFGRLFLVDARRSYEKLQKQTEEEKKDNEVLVSGNHDNEEEASSFSSSTTTASSSPLLPWLEKEVEETYTDKALEAQLKNLSKQDFQKKMGDANVASKLVGNTYTASVFLGLASLIDRVGGRDELTPGKSITLFSYGSGALATMYRLHVREPMQKRFTIAKMVESLQLMKRLALRQEVHPSEVDHALETRARMHRAGAPYSPVYPTIGRMFPGTYYLNGIDSSWVRTYSRVPLDAKVLPFAAAVAAAGADSESMLAPPIVLRLAARDVVSTPVTGRLRIESSDGDVVVEAQRRIACVITGTSAGLPGSETVFCPDNMKRLVYGHQCITPICGSTKMALLEKNVVQHKKLPDGSVDRVKVNTEEQVIKLAAQLGKLNLTDSYGIPAGLAETMDVAAQVAVAAGMEALKSAGLVSGKTNAPDEWKLPEKYRDSTGVVYASSFPAMDAAVGEVMKFLQSKTVGAADTMRLLSALRERMIRGSPGSVLSDDDEAAFARLLSRTREMEGSPTAITEESKMVYEFDRKFLFRVLVLGNAQLAQLAGCRGPNTQTNAACAGTTQAIGMAQDMLISGRAERVVVVAGDNASGGTLLPWLGSGFRALGATSTAEAVEDAALPFDKRRNGLLLGAGGIGIVLETEESSQDRLARAGPDSTFGVKARLLATQYSNSAFHGAALDRKHIAKEMTRFLDYVQQIHGISKAEIATHGVYFSHETCTHASSASSCSGNEVAALRASFGDDLLSKLLILNTKGFTGHPMGVSFEDVAAVEVLMRQVVPPVPNYKEKDDYLGNLNISVHGGPYACRYAFRFAAGFGSQVAFALYATAQYE